MSEVLSTDDSHDEWLEPLFDVAFDAPDGIARLRQLILSLAMQGKLVPQLASEAPASAMLRQIAAERSALLKAGKIRAPKEANPIADLEEPYALPGNWEWVRFGDIAQHNSGKTLDGGRNSGKPRDYITTSNLYWGRFQLENVRQMRIKDDELERCTARKGDLLICEGGEAGRAAVWNLDREVCFQNHVHRARFHFGVDPVFAYRLFEKLNGSGEIEQYRKGVGISNMSSKALASIPFPLPPLEEQKRIVARIDQLMSGCDELERLRQQQADKRAATRAAAMRQWLAGGDAAAKLLGEHFATFISTREDLAELRKAIVQLAVMGKLVKQDPDEKSVDLIRGEIEDCAKQLLSMRKVKYRDSNGSREIDSLRYAIPKSWLWMRFPDVVFYQEGPGIRNWQFRASGVKLLNVSNILTSGELDLSNSNKHVSNEEFDEKYRHFELKEGDLLFAGSGASWGKLAWFRGPGFRVMLNTSTMRLKFFHEGFSPGYLICFMKTEFFKSQLNFQLAGLQPNFGSTHLGKVVIPVPPLEEQKRIVSRIDQLMQLCDTLEQNIDTAKVKQTELLEAVMARV